MSKPGYVGWAGRDKLTSSRLRWIKAWRPIAINQNQLTSGYFSATSLATVMARGDC